MRPNRNGHTSPHTGKHFQYMAALALTLVTTKFRPGGLPRELTFTSVYDLEPGS